MSRFSTLYLLALFWLGLGYLTILPVFEGFDETAHYSSLRQITDAHTIPVFGKSYIIQDIYDYKGPLPYGSLLPPFDQYGMTYKSFFKDSTASSNYSELYRNTPSAFRYAPGRELNWQAQHPPLFYILFSPLISLTDHFSLVTQFLVLRSICLLVAITGLALGLRTIKNSTAAYNSIFIGFLVYPIIFPMMFPEFARLGNDSFCLLLTGFLAYLFSLWLPRLKSGKLPILIGITLGVGLSLKALFIPIGMALGFMLLLQFRKKLFEKETFLIALHIILPAICIGSGWYIYNYLTYGELSGGYDSILLAKQGGLAVNWKKNFSLYEVLRGLVAVFVSWSWGGTWSLTRLNPLLHLPLLLLTLWVISAYIIQLRRRAIEDIAWLPVWLIAAFGFGFIYHIVISVVLKGNGNTAGWYLHVLLPWMAIAVGMGITSIWQHQKARLLLASLLIYAVCFHIMALWSEFALFTGCAIKGDDKYYLFTQPYFCLGQISILFERMHILAWPNLATLSFGSSIICITYLAYFYARQKAKMPVLSA
jgi:hypothetical protein